MFVASLVLPCLVTALAAQQDSGLTFIADALAAADRHGGDTVVTLTGVLTSDLLPGQGSISGYMQDATRGIGLRMDDEVLERSYRNGDLVQATGTISTWRGRSRLRVSSLRLIGSIPPPAPRDLGTIELVGGRYEGILVRLRGKLTYSPEGPEEAVLEDDVGRIPVSIPDELLLDVEFAGRMLDGTTVTVTGFAEKAGEESGTGESYRISIDEQGDISFAPPPPYRTIALGFVAFAVAALIVYLAGRRGLAERRSREMEALVAHLEETRTTLEESESALRSSEAQYRSLVEHAPFGVFRSTLDGRILTANQALADMLRYTSGSDLVTKELARDLYARPDDWTELRASLAHRNVTPPEETRWTREDGSQLRARIRFQVVRGDAYGGTTLDGFVEDVTERDRLESRLRQAQKMEAVGQLAGGVAHDFNNLLTIIFASCEFLLTECQEENCREEVREIYGAGRRAAALTQQLLAFSRRQPLAPKVLDPNNVITDALKLLRRTVGEDVEVATSFGSECGYVEVDPCQLQQVLMNLVVNARDAMPTGGTITVETDMVTFDDEAVRERPGARLGRYVGLYVTDTGVGMTPETQQRLFEPFFTTKEVGHGTGLGLATVYGIVKQSNGYIEVESELGSGSVFKVYLPSVADPLAEPPCETFAAPGGGSETILLVEDAVPLRALARRVLQRAGYSLLEAADGEEAIHLADNYHGVIDAVVTDVVMPKKSGRELTEHLSKTLGRVKVLYISGYTDDAVIRHGVFEDSEAFLRKPFTPDSLLRALRALLDGGAIGEGQGDLGAPMLGSV
jgi:PAS domain S-box-containing protein